MKRRDFLTESSVLLGASLLRPAVSIGPSPDSATIPEGPNIAWSNPTHWMTLDQIHNLMESVCRDDAGNSQVGAFFLVSWLVENIRKDLKNATQYTKDLSYPTPFTKVNAGVELDPTMIDLTIKSGSRIMADNFQPVIALKEPKGPGIYNRIKVSFDPVLLKLNEDPAEPGKLRFYIAALDPNSPDYPKFQITPGTVNSALLQANGVDPKEYDRAEAAIRISAAPINLLEAFVASLPVLAIVEAMRQFGIGQPLHFTFEQDLIIVHGPSSTSPAAPCGPGAGTKISTTLTPVGTYSPTPGQDKSGFKLSFQHRVDGIDPLPLSKYPPFGYYFPLERSFKDFGIGVISPGVVASDHGDFAAFHWEYSAAARPKPNSVRVRILDDPTTHLPELQITIDCPFDVGGTAAVFMKVGCVMVPLLSSSVFGHIDPSTCTLKLALANTGSGPALVVTASYDCKADVFFINPPLIDLLLNIVMASFGNKLVAGELRRLVNSLNFPLIDLSALSYQDTTNNQWRLGRNFRSSSQSILVGFEQGKEARDPDKPRP